jgi:hypothetical protein
MQTILKVIKQESHDRVVFLTYNGNDIVGVNFHYDCDFVDYSFAKPCESLTDIFNRLKDNMPSLSDESRINKSIRLYQQAFILQDKHSIAIPKTQTSLIQKALNYYVEQSTKLNSKPTQDEHYELFDMQQLSAMMNYDISISIMDEDRELFASNHGLDFPIYNNLKN